MQQQLQCVFLAHKFLFYVEKSILHKFASLTDVVRKLDKTKPLARLCHLGKSVLISKKDVPVFDPDTGRQCNSLLIGKPCGSRSAGWIYTVYK